MVGIDSSFFFLWKALVMDKFVLNGTHTHKKKAIKMEKQEDRILFFWGGAGKSDHFKKIDQSSVLDKHRPLD